MPVLDASVVVAAIGGGKWADEADAVIDAEGGQLFAPHLIDAEVGHALRRAVAAGSLAVTRAESALSNLGELPIDRTPHGFLLDRAWRLRERVSFYDALYLALGQELEVPVLTLDASLARGAEGLPVQVELIAA